MQLPVICGSDEFIRYGVEKDVKKLEEIGYSVNYICLEGFTHDFVLWDKYIKLTLDELLPLKGHNHGNPLMLNSFSFI
ncbi:MAG: hypothetical protein K0S01_1513 [Herbinix sp.]|jgi:putative tributyrin esterase|nr:hypothetical protein [Herbinix sp.]